MFLVALHLKGLLPKPPALAFDQVLPPFKDTNQPAPSVVTAPLVPYRIHMLYTPGVSTYIDNLKSGNELATDEGSDPVVVPVWGWVVLHLHQSILPPDAFELSLTEIVDQLKSINSGLVLITGKVNSGKTTTLNALVQEVKDREDAVQGVQDQLDALKGENGYKKEIADAVKVEKERAELAEQGLDGRIDAIEALQLQAGSTYATKAELQAVSKTVGDNYTELQGAIGNLESALGGFQERVAEAEGDIDPHILGIFSDFIIFSASIPGRFLHCRQNSLQ